MRIAVVCLLAFAHGCSGDDDASGGGAGSSTGDPAETEACVACHQAQGESFALPSSHHLLLYCTTCHAPRASRGKGHADTRACADCHSEFSHPKASSDCSSCHDPHGSTNAFAIREVLKRPDGSEAAVLVKKQEGASDEGLVHTGPKAGSGLCESCHTKTRYYLANGQGDAHFAQHCPKCHEHRRGFMRP